MGRGSSAGWRACRVGGEVALQREQFAKQIGHGVEIGRAGDLDLHSLAVLWVKLVDQLTYDAEGM